MQQTNILIVDDDIPLAEEVAEVLREQGFSVTFARTLLQSEQKVKDNPFDLYIVDLLLPDGHGHEVIRNIRRSCSGGIVVLSGKLDEVDKVVALELGADDYVVKPFTRAELVARIKSLLRRMKPRNAPDQAAQLKSSEIIYQGVCTDLKARKVFDPSGDHIQLTKLEFDLWLSFLKGRNRVLSREQLIHSIRGCDWAGNDRSIDGLVSRLRKKLSICPDLDKNFETIRGVGYLLHNPE